MLAGLQFLVGLGRAARLERLAVDLALEARTGLGGAELELHRRLLGLLRRRLGDLGVGRRLVRGAAALVATTVVTTAVVAAGASAVVVAAPATTAAGFGAGGHR